VVVLSSHGPPLTCQNGIRRWRSARDSSARSKSQRPIASIPSVA